MYPQVESLEEARAHIACLIEENANLGRRVSDLEAEMDMVFHTPAWKRLWFLLNGWPYHRVVEQHEQQWRMWHRWFGRP